MVALNIIKMVIQGRKLYRKNLKGKSNDDYIIYAMIKIKKSDDHYEEYACDELFF